MSARGTPTLAVMTKGGASCCGGLICAAVTTAATVWIVVACMLVEPGQFLGPHSGRHARHG